VYAGAAVPIPTFPPLVCKDKSCPVPKSQVELAAPVKVNAPSLETVVEFKVSAANAVVLKVKVTIIARTMYIFLFIKMNYPAAELTGYQVVI
jgi:hypothetical protein